MTIEGSNRLSDFTERVRGARASSPAQRHRRSTCANPSAARPRAARQPNGGLVSDASYAGTWR